MFQEKTERDHAGNSQSLAQLMSGFFNHWWQFREPPMRCGRAWLLLLSSPSVQPRKSCAAYHAPSGPVFLYRIGAGLARHNTAQDAHVLCWHAVRQPQLCSVPQHGPPCGLPSLCRTDCVSRLNSGAKISLLSGKISGSLTARFCQSMSLPMWMGRLLMALQLSWKSSWRGGSTGGSHVCR